LWHLPKVLQCITPSIIFFFFFFFFKAAKTHLFVGVKRTEKDWIPFFFPNKNSL
jgi:hypothetical protein